MAHSCAATAGPSSLSDPDRLLRAMLSLSTNLMKIRACAFITEGVQGALTSKPGQSQGGG